MPSGAADVLWTCSCECEAAASCLYRASSVLPIFSAHTPAAPHVHSPCCMHWCMGTPEGHLHLLLLLAPFPAPAGFETTTTTTQPFCSGHCQHHWCPHGGTTRQKEPSLLVPEALSFQPHSCPAPSCQGLPLPPIPSSLSCWFPCVLTSVPWGLWDQTRVGLSPCVAAAHTLI